MITKSRSDMPLILLAAALILWSRIGFVAGQADSDGPQPVKLIREGTRIDDRPAVCRFNGERLSVELDGQENAILALENLAAQRILVAVRDDPNDNRWLLNGTITEFLGSNYVMLERVKRLVDDNQNY
jgi:hypothetical protein